MKPTDWDQAYKRLDKSDPMPPEEDNLWPVLVMDVVSLVLVLGAITFFVRWAIT